MAELVLCYGTTGSAKTSQLLFLAKYVYRKYGKRTRLASCDGGGWKPLEGAVDAGLIEAWGVSTIESPRSVLRKLTQGFWPEIDNSSGKPRLRLVAPVSDTWKKIGCFGMEGLTSMANVIMRDATNKQMVVAGDQAGQRGAIKFEENVVTMVDGRELNTQEKYSFATPGNYDDAQRAVYDYVSNLRSMPVHYVYLSALERKAEEEETRKTILGPAVVGKAVTAQVGSWVGDMIHMEDYFVDVPDPTHKLTPDEEKRGVKQRTRQETKVRAWFIRHPDPTTGVLFPAKPRVAPDQLMKLLEVFPGGYFEPTLDHGLDVYLETVDRLLAASSLSIREFMKECDQMRIDAAKVGGTDAKPAEKELVQATTGQGR